MYIINHQAQYTTSKFPKVTRTPAPNNLKIA